jgi:hypothetical protein
MKAKLNYTVKSGDIENMTTVKIFDHYTDAKLYMNDLYNSAAPCSYYCFESTLDDNGAVLKRNIIWTMMSCSSLYTTLKNIGFTSKEIGK